MPSSAKALGLTLRGNPPRDRETGPRALAGDGRVAGRLVRLAKSLDLLRRLNSARAETVARPGFPFRGRPGCRTALLLELEAELEQHDADGRAKVRAEQLPLFFGEHIRKGEK